MQASANTFPFNLRVVEARGLTSTKRDIADPFVVVKLKGLKHIFNSEKQSTEVQMNRENPVFNQDFLLHPKENDTILVKVMDKNTPLNRKLGKVLIPVSSYLNKSTMDSWFPIEGKSGRSGEVRLLINYGSGAFSGFKQYLASKNSTSLGSKHTTTSKTASVLPAEGTTIVKETKIVKEAALPVVTREAPVAPMANLNIGTTTVRSDAVKNMTLSRDTVIQERIHPVEEEIIQPVIHRERQQTEIHRVTQDIKEAQILPTVYQDKTLNAEYRGDFNKSRDFLAEETNTRAAVFNTRDIDATRHTKVVNAPIIEETIKKTVIEVVQPVVHRETTAPVVIRETLPIYEKVIEEPIIINDVRTSRTVNVLPTTVLPAATLPLQQQPAKLVKETTISSTTIGGNVPNLASVPLHQTYHNEQNIKGVLPGTFAHQTENRFEGHTSNTQESVMTRETLTQPALGTKIPPTTQTRPNQAFQSF